jgi:two-component system LytT family response regulator
MASLAATERAIRTVVVDAEATSRLSARTALEGEPDVRIVAECATADEAVDAILALRPDLVFLDAQIPGRDGFRVIEAVGPERMPPVVFLTNGDPALRRALDLHELDYVVKPLDARRFRDAFRTVRHRVGPAHAADQRDRLRALLETEPNGEAGVCTARLLVRVRDRLVVVDVGDVDWFQSAGNYVRIWVGQTCHLVRRSLASLAETLDPDRFARIHRSTIVNVERIAELIPANGGDYVAVLRDGRTLRVSRAYRSALVEVPR